ncbi:hypothetical protein B0H63DRAFT_517929 [Podospora didyma]|uniref:Uncharacterized protein n=1 Tax=Podospora didyma TaxID=330526 RepID=A0AAE0P7U4_9PEZI|nr:hypothetical protein B0H63DRAFT_517929 [Podospora didyma]
MHARNLLPLFFLGAAKLSVASPLLATEKRAASSEISAAGVIEVIMPSSVSCDGRGDECRTAAQASDFFITAFSGFTFPEMAAMLALVAVESVEMQYRHNVSPGRPGQGTSNMMMPNFVAMYATDVLGANAVAGKDPAAILDLVKPDQYNFGSAPWFLKTQCGPDVRAALQANPDTGFAAYMRCVGVDAQDTNRQAYWKRAKAGFQLA